MRNLDVKIFIKLHQFISGPKSTRGRRQKNLLVANMSAMFLSELGGQANPVYSGHREKIGFFFLDMNNEYTYNLCRFLQIKNIPRNS